MLNGSGFSSIHQALHASVLRQEVLAHNIANADTPHFKRSEVAFEHLLAQHIQQQTTTVRGQRTDARHFFINESHTCPEPKIVTDPLAKMNNNQNSVDIDKEMSLLAENQLRYQTLLRQGTHQIKMYQMAIEGRRI